MFRSDSYQIQKVSGEQTVEIKRLRAQVDLFWGKELKHYREYGLRDTISVVELGSGPGFVTEKLLRVFPRLDMTCVEIDPDLVTYASEHLKKSGFRRYRIVQASIGDTGLPRDSYDFAIVRLLIEHLSDPVKALKEIYRILKPGGKVVLVDNDFDIHLATYPPIPELRELYEAYCQARCAEGGNPRIGRQLPGLLKKAGFTNIDFEIICAHNEIVGDEVFLKSQGVGIPSKLVQDGYLSSHLLGKISVQWRKMVKDENHVIIRQLYMSGGEKDVEK
jgi:ubiquinone/menaquinone biosynthesis C-methylase UbiE